MDYIGMKCALCEKTFESGDDVVVCPECGAPHHRECYEADNKCACEEQHSDTFEYSEEPVEQTETSEENQDTENTAQCPRCKAANQKDAFYCNKCGYPMGINKTNTPPYGQQFNPFDPMGGLDPNTDMGDNVTLGEMTKFTQDKTPYFSRVFNNLKSFNKGKFNFSGFLFGGGYLLYRKMYKLGGFLTFLMFFGYIAYYYLAYHTPLYQELTNLNYLLADSGISTTQVTMDWFYGLDSNIQMLMVAASLSSIAQLVIQIVTGLCANKWYYKHCKKQIIKIKNTRTTDTKVTIETKGGVNTPLAISMFVVYIIVYYAPYLF